MFDLFMAPSSQGLEPPQKTGRFKFSGLRLLAIMYTAFRQIDPTMDTGADFAAEYQAALDMQSAPPKESGG